MERQQFCLEQAGVAAETASSAASDGLDDLAEAYREAERVWRKLAEAAQHMDARDT